MYFENCTFKKYLDFSNNIINGSLKIKSEFNVIEVKASKTIFKNEVDLSDLKFDLLNLEDTKFEKRLFLSRSFFKNLDLKGVSFYDEVQFLDMDVSKTNRETARIIKDSFEQQNNIIEANKFYALEMIEREKELANSSERSFFEWLVFKVHGLASNHSQDWLLALFWILSFSFSFVFIECADKFLDTKLEYIIIDSLIFITIISLSILTVQNKKINKFYLIAIFYLIYGFLTKDFTLNNIANNINPFSIKNSWDDITFSELIYKIIIGYLIYQFIVSIRQNTRRK